ncbi:transposable element Tcb2 transposase [Trichonephila clavipes]|nr:transposable element Tcb2 transposase [Trichonephila clavipes]
MTDHMLSCSRKNRIRTLVELRSSPAASSGRLASRSTIRRRLHERSLYARRPAICVLLTSHYRRKRFPWTCDQWRAVLYTDESNFSVGRDRRISIWRHSEIRFHP